MKLVKLFTVENLAVGILFGIVFSAFFAAINIFVFRVPRIIFIVMLGINLLCVVSVLFRLISDPIREKAFPIMAVNFTVILLFSIAAIRLAGSSFSEDDEIYSWNLWAIQHYEGKEVDFRFTLVPYPQLFSYWIAALYHAMGSVTIQSIPRFFLAIPTLIIGLTVIGMTRMHTWLSAAFTIIILFAVIAPVIPWYSKGLADTLMVSAVALSAWFLISYKNNPKKIYKLAISVACGTIAAMTKQAGLLWMFALLVVIGFGYLRLGWPKLAIVFAVIAASIALIWPLFVAPNFLNNQGVINASFAGRNYNQQLLYSINEYLFKRPELLVLFSASFYFGWKNTFLKLIILVAIIPSMLVWFLFGAYHIRLGAHVLALAGIVLTSALYFQKTSCTQINYLTHKKLKLTNSLTIISFIILIAYIFLVGFGIQAVAGKAGVDLYDGAKTTLKIQFGKSSEEVISIILTTNSRVWATSNYTYGSFYGRVPVGLPDYTQPLYNEKNVKKDLLEFRADYAAQSGVVPYGPASDFLKILADRCPEAFIPLLTPPNQKSFTLYKVVLDKLALSTCS